MKLLNIRLIKRQEELIEPQHKLDLTKRKKE